MISSIDENPNIQRSVSVPILLDIIEREGFEFSAHQLSILLGVVGDDMSDYYKLVGELNFSGVTSSYPRVKLAYTALFWGCGFVSSGGFGAVTFGNAALKYYTHIGKLDYFLEVAGGDKSVY